MSRVGIHPFLMCFQVSRLVKQLELLHQVSLFALCLELGALKEIFKMLEVIFD